MNKKSWNEIRYGLTVENNIVKIDFNRKIDKDGTSEIKLQGRFVQQGDPHKNQIYVKMLNDEKLEKGKVHYLEGKKSNFIWSDQALLSRHNNSSNDYLNGFLIQKTNEVFQVNHSKK